MTNQKVCDIIINNLIIVIINDPYQKSSQLNSIPAKVIQVLRIVCDAVFTKRARKLNDTQCQPENTRSKKGRRN